MAAPCPAPPPINDTKPSFVAASAVVYWCEMRAPEQQGGRHRGGAEEAPREPEPRLLQQGPISSLTKAAMQYWRATGIPKLQYLRAARALLTALCPPRPPAPPSSPPTPKHRPTEYLGQSFAGERTEEQWVRDKAPAGGAVLKPTLAMPVLGVPPACRASPTEPHTPRLGGGVGWGGMYW